MSACRQAPLPWQPRSRSLSDRDTWIWHGDLHHCLLEWEIERKKRYHSIPKRPKDVFTPLHRNTWFYQVERKQRKGGGRRKGGRKGGHRTTQCFVIYVVETKLTSVLVYRHNAEDWQQAGQLSLLGARLAEEAWPWEGRFRKEAHFALLQMFLDF